jgi:hypothetical protein
VPYSGLYYVSFGRAARGGPLGAQARSQSVSARLNSRGAQAVLYSLPPGCRAVNESLQLRVVPMTELLARRLEDSASSETARRPAPETRPPPWPLAALVVQHSVME